MIRSPLFRSTGIALALAWMAGLGWYLCRGATFPEWPARLLAAAALAGWLAGAAAAGSLLLQRWDRLFTDRIQRLTFVAAAGIALWTLLSFGLGIAGLWNRPAAWIAWLAGVGLAIHRRQDLLPLLRVGRTGLSRWGRICLGLAACFAGLGLLIALCPPTQYDALKHHFLVARLYTEQGGLYSIPFHFFSRMPQNQEMLYAMAFLWQGDLLAQMIHWILGLLLLLATYDLADDPRDGRFAGILAVLLVASIPQVILLSGSGHVDLGMAFYATLGLRAAFLGRSTGLWPWWGMSGLCFGFAYGIKPVSLLAASFAGLLAAAEAIRRRWMPAAAWAGGFVLLALPWWIRALAETGNPVFPFLSSLFPSRGYPPDFLSVYFGHVRSHGGGGSANPGDWLVRLWSLARGDTSFGGGFDYLGPALFLLLPFAFAAGRTGTGRPAGLAAAWIYLLWNLTSPVARFLIPAYPLAAAAIAAGMGRLFRRRGAWPTLLVGGPALWNMAVLLDLLSGSVKPFDFAAGTQTRSQYLRRVLPSYAGVEEAGPSEGRTLWIAEPAAYYGKGRLLFPTEFDRSPLVVWAEESRDERDLRQRLEREGIRRIAVHESELDRWIKGGFPVLWGMSEESKDLLARFSRRYLGRPSRRIGNLSLYELKP